MHSATLEGIIGCLQTGQTEKALNMLKTEAAKLKTEEERIEFIRINNDVNGNPRYVCHFLNFQTDKERNGSEPFKYETAIRRANKIGGKKYHNKRYGGGIVFQSYNTNELEKAIKELVNSL